MFYTHGIRNAGNPARPPGLAVLRPGSDERQVVGRRGTEADPAAQRRDAGEARQELEGALDSALATTSPLDSAKN